MYMRNTIFLHSEIPSRMRPVLSVKLRQVRGIVSAVVEEKKVTVYIARRYIKNGIMGLVKDHQANADTLTATAVAASVLAGKPESSLTLLALSNGAEMMTEYAAEKARRQISGLLKLDQRDVWLVENGHERKVPVESLKRGDLIAVHLGEKICVDG